MHSTTMRARTAAEPLVFKVASEPWELEQIHRLNYATFVEEIPQHAQNEQRVLVDRFHDDNTYIICLSGRELLGMVCLRDKRPFSLEQKISDLWSYLPPARNACELRLLAAHPDHRRGRVFPGLARALSEHCLERGYDLALISGTTRQLKLYKHMGFVPFGPLIGTPEAPYQPMYLTPESFHGTTLRLAPLRLDGPVRHAVSFLPGPVPVSDAVRKAFAGPAISHRGREFLDELEETRNLACKLVGARHVQFLMGTGTLANDTVAAQLTALGGRGLVLTNGEFGDRLAEAATRFGLKFDQLGAAWGEPFDMQRLAREIAQLRPAWLWCVHAETSTGLLNDLPALRELCGPGNVRLCADCISTVGNMPVDLAGVWMATATGNKGIAALPGIAMVFHHHQIEPNASLPRYLDLGLYASREGVPFTFSSNLLHALKTALEQADPSARLARTAAMAQELRRGLAELGLRVVADAAHALAAVITVELPPPLNSSQVGRCLGHAGYLLSYESDYLRQRNWVQVCLMGEHDPAEVGDLLAALRGIAAPAHAAAQ